MIDESGELPLKKGLLDLAGHEVLQWQWWLCSRRWNELVGQDGWWQRTGGEWKGHVIEMNLSGARQMSIWNHVLLNQARDSWLWSSWWVAMMKWQGQTRMMWPRTVWDLSFESSLAGGLLGWDMKSMHSTTEPSCIDWVARKLRELGHKNCKIEVMPN